MCRVLFFLLLRFCFGFFVFVFVFVGEWSDVRTFYNNSLESFQVILYNTDLQTVTGDDEMKLQYKEFNNNSVGDYPVGNYDGPVVHGQYCTVGIENHLSNDGLQYTFNNTYHPIEIGRASCRERV